jgi:propionyl-CoA carboxylase alpha chain
MRSSLFPHYTTPNLPQEWSVAEDARELSVSGSYESGALVFDVEMNDAQHTLQVANCSDANSNYDVQYKGTTFQLKVFSLAEASAQRHMPVKIPMDTSKFIVSPMPGAVMNIGVEVGDEGTCVCMCVCVCECVCVCDMHT